MTADEESFLRYIDTIPRAELNIRYVKVLAQFTELHGKYTRFLEEHIALKLEDSNGRKEKESKSKKEERTQSNRDREHGQTEGGFQKRNQGTPR